MLFAVGVARKVKALRSMSDLPALDNDGNTSALITS